MIDVCESQIRIDRFREIKKGFEQETKAPLRALDSRCAAVNPAIPMQASGCLVISSYHTLADESERRRAPDQTAKHPRPKHPAPN